MYFCRVRRERMASQVDGKKRKSLSVMLDGLVRRRRVHNNPVTFSAPLLSCLGASWHLTELEQWSGLRCKMQTRTFRLLFSLSYFSQPLSITAIKLHCCIFYFFFKKREKISKDIKRMVKKSD